MEQNLKNDVCQPMRIALCIWMFKPGTGGLQAHAAHLAKHLIRLGHEVTVITRCYSYVPTDLGFLQYEEAESLDNVDAVPVLAVSYPQILRRCASVIVRLRNSRWAWKFGVQLFRFLARSKRKEFAGFDVIHYVGQADQLFGFLAADAATYHQVPFSVQPTCHPHEVGDSPMDIYFYKKARRALVHTHYEADYLRPMLDGMSIDVVGNGIEDCRDGDGARFREEYGIDGPIVLYIGRRDYDKGYALVIEAFNLLSKKREDVVLVCMGPSGSLPIDQSDGVIHFEFASEQLKHDALAACDCLCVPSEGESFGLVYMEAGRYAKPVIARQLPVLEELLDQGKAGVLVGDLDVSQNKNSLSPEVLMESIVDLLDNPQKAFDVGKRCFEVSEQFIWQNVVKKFETSYKKLLRS